MRRRRPGIGAELLPVALIVVCLAGTLGSVITMHRRALVSKIEKKALPKARILAIMPNPNPLPTPSALPSPEIVTVEEPPTPAPPRVDPTIKALEAIAAEANEQERAKREADLKTSALRAAFKKAEAESTRWRTRESLVKTQLSELDRKAQNLDQEADALAMERDLLALERDAAKALVQKAKTTNGGYSVLPNKTANGTWQRPVIIECRNGEAILQPQGQHFNMLDLSPLLGPRGSPLIGAVAKELMKIQGSASPDGAAIIPYIYFIVRPDGVRPFYDARSRLEPLGIAFGYELVEQNWEIEYPDFDTLTAWDGSGIPFSAVKPKATLAQGGVTRPGGSGNAPIRRGTSVAMPDEGGRAFLWPADRPSPKATTDQVADSPYVWPSRRGGPPSRGSASFMGSEEARPGFGGTNPTSPNGATGHGGRGGFQDRELASSGASGARSGDRRPAPMLGSEPPGSGSSDVSSLVPVGPGGLPEFSKPENLVPDPRRPGGDGSVDFSTDGPPKRPATGRVRIDPTVLAEAAAAAEEDEARRTLMPWGGGALGLDETNPTSGLTGSTDAGDSPPPPSGSGSGSRFETAQSNHAPQGSIGTATSTKPAASSQPAKPPMGGSRSNAPATGSPSTTGIEMPALGSSGSPGDEGQEQAKMPKFEPRKPLVENSIQVPLDLVVACGPNGVVIHPGGYRISRATLRKEGLLRIDLKTIVRNHELIDALVKPIPRLQFLVETGGAETYQEARRQTVLSGLSWPVTVKVSENSTTTIFSKERF